MKPLIQTATDVYQLLYQYSRSDRRKELLSKGVYISSKIRKEILISENQGKITLDGQVKWINFKNKTGGVWLANIVDMG